jgi:hypothetical protein
MEASWGITSLRSETGAVRCYGIQSFNDPPGYILKFVNLERMVIKPVDRIFIDPWRANFVYEF